ncbi:TonB-dependent receptor [Janthinobacterium fluminis]|uniref:TonB-dependent receptor n=1 Tax=Janthinobacterium fluminis TaxID=2987524 RepID=A0ABT5K254_9BURK|nr:TonB-dependent receptor [Janthinobacterium fluminis]MDC8759067.1 TonB-dependent receptor [Janthinobacterium fluminis]
MRHIIIRTPLLAALLAASQQAGAAAAPPLPEVTVIGNRPGLIGVADAAGDATVTARQLATRPLLRTAELLETLPGMIVTQHSGDGKANQYFLRGFNLDHGSDFATSVMGMPANVASHAHGQGYMDLNFLMPELIAGIQFHKGVYAAEDGDFSNTGSSRIEYQRQLKAPFVDVTLGAHRHRRVLAAGSGEWRGFDLMGAVEAAGNDGPWDLPARLRKRNGVARLSKGSADDGFSVTAMAYESDWRATEHVPQRAIAGGEIGRYGALSGSDGGQTHRYSLSGEWAGANAAGASRVNAYVIDYGLNYFAAPSGFISGPRGDQHEQADRRLIWGGAARQSLRLGEVDVTAGVQLRQDRVRQVGLYETVDRVRSGTVRQDRLTETAVGLYVEARRQWTPWLRSTLGLRRDQIRASVTPTGGAFNMDNGGKVGAGQTSPKLALVLRPSGARGDTELYLNWGYGFHSNDVRGATSATHPADGSPADKLALFAKSTGAEIGLRSKPLPGWNTSLSLWRMSAASELVFVGDEGVTEARGASRRHGVEWSNYFAPSSAVNIDADLAWSHARFREPVDGGGAHVPNAIPLTASLGLSYEPGGAWFGGLRLRYLGAYALEESNTHKSVPFWLANLKLGYRITPTLQLGVDVLNLFDRKANDIEYWGGACTRGEQADGSCGGGIAGRLVHPLEPRTMRLSLRASF